MSVEERLRRDLKEAIRAREGGRETVSVIRMSLSALNNARIEKGEPLSQEEEWEILGREMKQRQESAAEFEKAGRRETAERMERELEILEKYLPPPLDEAELESMVQEALRETGAAEPRHLGKVMGRLMRRVKGRADGNRVREAVQRLLSQGDSE